MIQYPRSNFSQRQFEIPLPDESSLSPSYSYADSRSSSTQNANNQTAQSQHQSAGSDSSSQSPRRGFNLGNMFGGRKKSSEQKTNDDKIEKMPKRRGPKPDSKPALSRRQALNRQAQRTHRERKEYYTKSLEYQIDSLKETSQQAISERQAIETAKRVVENENRLLRQLLQANNIPFIGSTAPETNQSLVAGNLPNFKLPSLSNGLPLQTNYSGFLDPNSSRLTNSFAANSIGSQHSTMSTTPPIIKTSPSNPSSSLPSSMSTSHTPTYSPSDASGLAIPPQTSNGYSTSSKDYSTLNGTNGLLTGLSYTVASERIFSDPNNPKFISFVVELEENCKDHAGFMYERLNNMESEDVSGHALMFTAPTISHIAQHPGDYQAKPPDIPTVNLNTLLANCQQFNRNGEVTPVTAVHMIAEDPRFSLLSQEDFQRLKQNLKTKSRCYGFGAVLEDYEVKDAMDEACAKYLS